MSVRSWLILGCALAMTACGFGPTAPFEGFDGKGTRLSGSFDTKLSASGKGGTSTAASFQGLGVSLRERKSLATTVGSSGGFELDGLPAGSWSLVFSRDGREVGDIRFTSVRRNQRITVKVGETRRGEIVLLSQTRDSVSFEGECPRGAGFWCQNQDGKNPNLTAQEFEEFATEAATSLSALPALDTPAEIAAAVCNTGDQLLRQLATLALNLAAETITLATALSGEPYPTVGAAFEAAVAVANDPSATKADRNAIKDVLERINDSENTAGVCEDDEDDDDTPGTPPLSGKMTICHIPPGNPENSHTLEIDGSAWPAHEAHGDTLGACQ